MMIDADTFAQYRKDIEQFIPKKEVEVKGNQSWYALVVENLRLVLPIARRYAQHTPVELLDLIQAGNLGLMRAAQDYDPERAKFSTHADWWIKAFIRRLIAQESTLVSISEEKMRLASHLQRYLREHPEVPLEDVAHHLNLTLEDAQALFVLTQGIVSLSQAKYDESDESLADSLEATAEECNPEHKLFQDSDALLIQELLALLTPVERQVVEKLHGLYGQQACTQLETAQTLHINKWRIVKIEGRAMMKMSSYAKRFLREARSA